MKVAALYALVVATVAGATDIDTLRQQIPACATPCLLKATTGAGCTPGDYTCSCSKKDAITQAATPCLMDPSQGCPVADLGNVAKISMQICNLVADANSGNSTSLAAPASSAAASSSIVVSVSGMTTVAAPSKPCSTAATAPTGSNGTATTTSPATVVTAGASQVMAPLGAAGLVAALFGLAL